jgi:phage shock protein E
MRYVVFFGIIALFVFFIYRMFATSTDDHTMENILAKDPVILDVRTPEEFSRGHLEGAVNFPLGELEKGTPIRLDHKRPILTCCSHGVRSVQAVELLQARGYKNAINGGAWTNLQMIMDKDHREKEPEQK